MPLPPSRWIAASQEAVSSAYSGPMRRRQPRVPWHVAKASANSTAAPASISRSWRRRPVRWRRSTRLPAATAAALAPAARAVVGPGLAVAARALVGGSRRARIGADRVLDLGGGHHHRAGRVALGPAVTPA